MTRQPNKLQNIIIVTPSFSVPGIKGYEKVLLQWIEALAPTYNIHVVDLDSTESLTEETTNWTAHYCKIGLGQKLRNLLRSLCRLEPLQSSFLRSQRSIRLIVDIEEQLKPEFILFITIRTNFLAKLISTNRRYILAVDSMTLNFQGKYKKSKNIYRVLYYYEYLMLKFRETKMLSMYDRAIFVSDRDASKHGKTNSIAIPLAIKDVDINRSICEEPGLLLFTGNMDYEPNRTAVIWFYEEVWKKFNLSEEGYSFTVCGRKASDWEYLVNKKDIEIKSNVPDIFDEIRRCSIYIAPMQSGSGMQYKILEAMACSKPIVTSTLGIGSILKSDFKNAALIADSDNEFYESIKRLHTNDTLRKSVGENANQLVKKYYVSSSVNKHILDFVSNR